MSWILTWQAFVRDSCFFLRSGEPHGVRGWAGLVRFFWFLVSLPIGVGELAPVSQNGHVSCEAVIPQQFPCGPRPGTSPGPSSSLLRRPFGHSEQRLWLFKKGHALQLLRLGSALWLLCGSSGDRCASPLQPALPAGPGPEALSGPEPVHGQPGHVQQRASQLLPLLQESGVGDADDGEFRPVALQAVEVGPGAARGMRSDAAWG